MCNIHLEFLKCAGKARPATNRQMWKGKNWDVASVFSRLLKDFWNWLRMIMMVWICACVSEHVGIWRLLIAMYVCLNIHARCVKRLLGLKGFKMHANFVYVCCQNNFLSTKLLCSIRCQKRGKITEYLDFCQQRAGAKSQSTVQQNLPGFVITALTKKQREKLKKS